MKLTIEIIIKDEYPDIAENRKGMFEGIALHLFDTFNDNDSLKSIKLLKHTKGTK